MKSKFLLLCILISSLTSCGQRNDPENIVETDSGNQVAQTNEIESEETTVETTPTDDEPVVYVDQRTPEEKARLAAEGERMRAASVEREKERQETSANIDSLKIVKCVLVTFKYSLVSIQKVSTLSMMLNKFYSAQAHQIPTHQRKYLGELANRELLNLTTEQELLFIAEECGQEPAAKEFIKNGNY
jgi:hypothetical protein